MATTNSSGNFSPSTFLEDIKKLAHTLGAPYSEPAILKVLEVFEECFKDAVVVWRTTDRPGDALNYRLYLRRKLDTISMATQAGLLKPDNPLARMVSSCSLLCNGETEQWVDFDPNAGLAKTWVWLRVPRPVDDILDVPEMPAAVRAHGPTFHSLGLKLVTFIAVDYHGDTMNLYFVAPGPFSRAQAAQYTNLAGCSPPTDHEYQDLLESLHPEAYHFAVTMDFHTGRITRVAFYAMDFTLSKTPTMSDRIVKFLAEAPSYDQHRMRIFSW